MIGSFRLSSVGGLALALAVTAATSPVSAVKCGDTITKNTVLIADLLCDGDPALTVVGPATLDLNGHTVSCGDACLYSWYSDAINGGIRISGRGATIKNGNISNCDSGVAPYDKLDFHGALIKDIIASNNCRYGVNVNGNNNKLQNVTSKGNGYSYYDEIDYVKEGYGIDVTGSSNKLLHVTAIDNYIDDISVRGNKNQVKDCFVARSGDGIFLSGTNNTAISNLVEDIERELKLKQFVNTAVE